MSVLAGYMPWLPSTPKPAGAGARVPVRDVTTMGAQVPRSRLAGLAVDPIKLGDELGCWRIVEEAPKHPTMGRRVVVQCTECGVRKEKTLSVLRVRIVDTHKGCGR